MPRKVRKSKKTPATSPTDIATSVLDRATKTVAALEKAFETVRTARGVTSGAPKDEEQDLLRAALVFAAAGLDSALKHLIRSALPPLLPKNVDVRKQFEQFVSKAVRSSLTASESSEDSLLLARLLTGTDSRDQLLQRYIEYLTGSSLQSAEELSRAAAALGLNPSQVGIDKKELKPIFDARNQIIHELDIDLTRANRGRRSRQKKKVLEDAKKLIAIGEGLVGAVSIKLDKP